MLGFHVLNTVCLMAICVSESKKVQTEITNHLRKSRSVLIFVSVKLFECVKQPG